jgi:hypothetical protein
MSKKILISGCSHVFGHGFDDSLDGKFPSQYAWPHMIQQNFDCETINLSSPGSSPISCIEGIQNFKNKKELSAIMIILPGSNRYLYRTLDQNSNPQDVYYTAYGQINSNWDRVLEKYYRVCHNWRTSDINFISYAGYLQHLSVSHKIPLWLGTVLDEDHTLLKRHGLNLNFSPSWETYCQTRNFDRLADGHYGHNAHKTFFSEFVSPWLEKKFSPL